MTQNHSARPESPAPGISPTWRRRLRPVLTVLAAVVCLLLLRGSLRSWATESPHVGASAKVRELGDGTGPLVVVLHGMGGPESMKELLAALPGAPTLVNAGVMAPEYPSRPRVNLDPAKLAMSVYAAIDRSAGDRPVVLVGHSMGGMILRYAYLRALEQQRPWAARTRFVLLASINRGWTTKIADKLGDQLKVRLGAGLLPMLGMGDLYANLRRGSSFVADIRLRWMLAMRQLKERGGPVPHVVQVRGIEDSIARPEDTADLESTPEFSRIELGDTDHSSVLHFDGSMGAERKSIILGEIAGVPTGRGQSGPQSTEICAQPDESIGEVILAVHGMRTEGHWANLFWQESQSTRPSAARFKDNKRVQVVSYGWFPMVPFLLFNDRQEKIQVFLDAYTEAKACYPKATVSVVAHSNGTYIVANAMRQVKAVKVRRMAFAGSVLPQRFNWLELRTQISDVVANYRSNGDLIVGVFPHLYEIIPGVEPDLGAAGLWGFKTSSPFVVTLPPVAGGHSTVVEDYRPELTRFLDDDVPWATSKSHPYVALHDTAPLGAGVSGISLTSPFWWFLILVTLLWTGKKLLAKRRSANSISSTWRRQVALYAFPAYVLVIAVLAFVF